MIARLITMLAILAITMVTTAASARMSASGVHDHSVHFGEMMHAPDNVELACDGDQHCGTANTGACEFVCAGLSAFLPSPDLDNRHAHEPASHGLPSEAIHVGRAPGLNLRPPKLRLL